MSEGRRLADALGQNVTTLLLGSNIKDKAATLGHYGADKVLVADDPRLETYTTDANGMMQNRDISAVQIHTVTDVTQYEEAPWVSKHGGLYYLTYASGFPESIAHATSSSPEGPWQYRGVILDPVPNSSTIHPAVFDFCGATYIAHHNGALPTGDSYRRSVCMDRVSFGSDGTIDRIPAN